MGTVNNTYPVHVIVDDREVRSGVIDAFKSMENVEVEIHRLSVGDYEIDHRLLFERKTLLDLVEAIKMDDCFGKLIILHIHPCKVF